jgi:predicted dehydrogenase
MSVISSGTERSVVQASQRSLMARVIDRPELALKAVDRVRRDGLRRTRDMVREQMQTEFATGYSCAGTVIEVGQAVRGISVGDRVACAGAGRANHAEVVCVPHNLCARIPDGVPIEAAALTTIAAIALHGVRLADVRVGERVAVIGCGLVGQIACRLLLAAGAEVYALDLDPDKVAWAVEAGVAHGVPVGPGAADAVRVESGGIGVDQVLVTAAAPSNDPLLLATEIARDRGAVVLVGDVQIDIPRDALYMKELAFRVSRSYGPGRYDPDYEDRGLDYPIAYVRWTEQRNMECVLDLQARGAMTLRDLIEDVVPIERAQEAYARLSGPPEQRPRGALAFAYASDGDAVVNGSRRRVRRSRSVAPRTSPGAIRLGVIGPGAFANRVLLPAFARAGAELVATAGGSGLSAEATARRSGSARAITEEELIGTDDVDAVVIATRHDSHAELARRCLESGKHVFCEKPLALDAAGLESVMAAEASAQRVLMVGFNRRFAPHVRTAREFLAAGGRITGVYRVSAGAIDPTSWVHDLELGGGRLIGECCHFFDTLAFLAGSPIAGVHASGFGGPSLALQSHDNLLLSIDFADGSIASLAYVSSGASSVAKERAELFAGERTVILDDYTAVEMHSGAETSRAHLRVQDKGHDEEVRQFLHAIRTGALPISLAEIENVHRACFAAVESLRTGLPVPVGSAAPGDDDPGMVDA